MHGAAARPPASLSSRGEERAGEGGPCTTATTTRPCHALRHAHSSPALTTVTVRGRERSEGGLVTCPGEGAVDLIVLVLVSVCVLC